MVGQIQLSAEYTTLVQFYSRAVYIVVEYTYGTRYVMYVQILVRYTFQLPNSTKPRGIGPSLAEACFCSSGTMAAIHQIHAECIEARVIWLNQFDPSAALA